MNTLELEHRFEEIYGKRAEHTYFAPGRVNLIGEHTDYNGGLVFPCALSFGTYLLIAKREDRQNRFSSVNMDRSYTANAKRFRRQTYRLDQVSDRRDERICRTGLRRMGGTIFCTMETFRMEQVFLPQLLSR